MLQRRILATVVTTARYHTTAAISHPDKFDPRPPLTSSPAGERKFENLAKRLSSLVYPRRSAVVTIWKWKEEGHWVQKYQLNRIVRKLRLHRRFKHALEICEWMTTQEDIKLTPGDYAVHLDLIAKLRGLNNAEQFFIDMPEKMRRQPTLSSLLHTYVQHKAYDKAEALWAKMVECGYLNHPLPYNHMMTMYLENGKLEKIPELIEMLKENTTPDVVTYSMWLTICQSQNDVETAENVFLEMKKAKVEPNCFTYSILASLYIKKELNHKAEVALREMEQRVSRKHRSGYAALINLHASLGNKKEVERIWKTLKSVFYKLNDEEYTCMIGSLLKLGELEKAEKCYDEWESISPTGDSRVPNLLLGEYIYNNQIQKARTFFDRFVRKGIKPSYTNWELLTRGYINSKQADEVLYFFKKALCSVKKWEPNLEIVRDIYQLLEEKEDIEGAEKLLSVLRKSGHVTTEIYNWHLQVYVKAEKMPPIIEERMAKDGVLPDSETNDLLILLEECVLLMSQTAYKPVLDYSNELCFTDTSSSDSSRILEHSIDSV